MRRVVLIAIVALAGCAHPVSPPTTQATTKRSNWVLSADAKPDDVFCVAWTVDVDAGDSRPFSCMSVATVRRLVRSQRNAE